MTAPHDSQAAWLLAHEGASATSAKSTAAAAGHVYDKLNLRLGPLLGMAGAEALFLRSAKLANLPDAAELGVGGSSAKLRASLMALDAPTAAAAAQAFFAALLALVTSFIGERLTTQVVRSAWPAIPATPTEPQ